MDDQLHGIYFNQTDQVYGLFINGDWVMVSVVRDDCVIESVKQGYKFD